MLKNRYSGEAHYLGYVLASLYLVFASEASSVTKDFRYQAQKPRRAEEQFTLDLALTVGHESKPHQSYSSSSYRPRVGPRTVNLPKFKGALHTLTCAYFGYSRGSSAEGATTQWLCAFWGSIIPPIDKLIKGPLLLIS